MYVRERESIQKMRFSIDTNKNKMHLPFFFPQSKKNTQNYVIHEMIFYMKSIVLFSLSNIFREPNFESKY